MYMVSRRFRVFLATLLLAFGLVAPAMAQAPSAPADKQASAAPKSNFFLIEGGLSEWPGLGDIVPGPGVPRPERFGAFKTEGYAIELSYHHRVAQRVKGGEVRLGGAFGVMFHSNERQFQAVFMPSGSTEPGGLYLRSGFIAPSVQWVLGAPGHTRFYLSGGAGLYIANFVEMLSDGMEVAEYFRKNAFGGFAGAGVTVPLTKSSDRFAFCAETKAHFVSYGDLLSFSPGVRLTGPSYTFQAGIVF